MTSGASASAVQVHSRRRPTRTPSPAGWVGTRPVVWRPLGGPGASRIGSRRDSAALPSGPRISCASTLKSRRSRRPLSRTLVPGRSRSASQAWLNQIAFSEPLPSATVASRIRRLRRRVGRTCAERTSPTIVERSPMPQPGDLGRSGAVGVAVRDVVDQVAERLEADPRGRLGELRPDARRATSAGAGSDAGRCEVRSLASRSASMPIASPANARTATTSLGDSVEVVATSRG